MKDEGGAALIYLRICTLHIYHHQGMKHHSVFYNIMKSFLKYSVNYRYGNSPPEW